MSDTEKPERIAGKRRMSPLVMALVIAALVALVVAALYVFSAAFGNRVAATGETTTMAAVCSAPEPGTLNDAAGGEVAAFVPAERAISVRELSFLREDGSTTTLADWQGRTVLLNLWATWCAPCRREMPSLDALQNEMGGADFEVVAVSLDLGTAEKPKQFYSDIGLQHLGFFHDPSLELLNALKRQSLAFGLPATVLIDENGCVLGALNGPAEWASEDAKALIRAGQTL